VDVDLAKVQTLGVPVSDAYNALQTFLGGLYANDFNAFGHTWQVLVEAQPEFRTGPSDVNRFYVRSRAGDMVPLGTLATVRPTTGPDVIYRYNRFRAVQPPWSNCPPPRSPLDTVMSGPAPPTRKRRRRATKA
jgi:multidrug efflux pump subunit AcrB